uniref:Uncharacterized protein n=1 Tax=Arundo donax TaxID=35708 RepID=A0A0A9GVZ4_ARUDO
MQSSVKGPGCMASRLTHAAIGTRDNSGANLVLSPTHTPDHMHRIERHLINT